MTTIGWGPTIEILAVAAACSVVVGSAGLAVAWRSRRRSLRWQLLLVAAVSVLGSYAGVLAVSRLMLLSDHDLAVVTLVGIVAAVATSVVAAVVGTRISRWSDALTAELRTWGSPDAAAPGAPTPAPSGPRPRELQALSLELADTRARLAEAEQGQRRLEESRRELVSWVSHDLRTPLAGLRAMAEALEDGLAADPDRFHRQMRQEVDRTAAMVDDLFELSRIHAGVLSLTPEPVAVLDLVSEAIAGTDAVARARRVRVDGRVEDGLEALVDPAGLSRVMSNLVMNAIRHTPADGSVEIEGRSVPGGVELSVSDGCGGVPADDVERMFDVGWRGRAARTPDGSAGAGLGLAIVKGIVEAHRGAVAVEDVVHHASGAGVAGCRFRVTLPLAPA